MSLFQNELLDDWFADDNYSKTKPVNPNWIFLDGDFVNIYGSGEDVISDAIPKKVKKVKPLKNKITILPKQKLSKQKKSSLPLLAINTDHYVRDVDKKFEIVINFKERLKIGISSLQEIHDVVGKWIKIKVGHDSDCLTFNERECTCCPDIDLMVDDSIYSIDSNGLLKIIGHS
jgi:hypothetical protein